MIGSVLKRIKNEYCNFCFLLIYVMLYLFISVNLNLLDNQHCIIVMGEKLALADGIKEGKVDPKFTEIEYGEEYGSVKLQKKSDDNKLLKDVGFELFFVNEDG